MEQLARPTTVAGSVGRWWLNRSSLLAGMVLLTVSAVAWILVVHDAITTPAPSSTPQESMSGMGTSFSAAGAAGFVGSWGVMMAAMMLPSAIPMIALYRTVGRRMTAGGRRVAPTVVFAVPYLLAWVVVGIPAYVATTALSAAGAQHAGVARLAPYGVAAVLVGAGAYQFSAAKQVCLRHCQTPLTFLTTRWRPGVAGGIRIGLVHAGYCLGCCWALMLVLVAAGAMGLPWVLLIATAVFVEKIVPRGQYSARVIGLVLAVLGLAVAAHPALAGALRT